MALESFDGKQTNWEGLWFHSEYNGYSSAVIKLSELKKFKGNVRLYVRKNKFFNKGENGRPNMHFCLKDAKSDTFTELQIEPEAEYAKQDEYGDFYTRDGERLYTEEEVRKIINGTVADVEYGIHDPYDILPEDFV